MKGKPLTKEMKSIIINRYKNSELSIRQVAKSLDLSATPVNKVLKGVKR